MLQVPLEQENHLLVLPLCAPSTLHHGLTFCMCICFSDCEKYCEQLQVEHTPEFLINTTKFKCHILFVDSVTNEMVALEK
jgi:hypothetical protein